MVHHEYVTWFLIVDFSILLDAQNISKLVVFCRVGLHVKIKKLNNSDYKTYTMKVHYSQGGGICSLLP